MLSPLLLIGFRVRYGVTFPLLFVASVLQCFCSLHIIALALGTVGFLLSFLFAFGAHLMLFISGFLPYRGLSKSLVTHGVPKDALAIAVCSLSLAIIIAVGEVAGLFCTDYKIQELGFSPLSHLVLFAAGVWFICHSYPSVLLVTWNSMAKPWSAPRQHAFFDRHAEEIVRNSPYPWLVDSLESIR